MPLCRTHTWSLTRLRTLSENGWSTCVIGSATQPSTPSTTATNLYRGRATRRGWMMCRAAWSLRRTAAIQIRLLVRPIGRLGSQSRRLLDSRARNRRSTRFPISPQPSPWLERLWSRPADSTRRQHMTSQCSQWQLSPGTARGQRRDSAANQPRMRRGATT